MNSQVTTKQFTSARLVRAKKLTGNLFGITVPISLQRRFVAGMPVPTSISELQ